MTEREKCDAGLIYDTWFLRREEEHMRCMELCHEYNHHCFQIKTGESQFRVSFSVK